MGLHGEIAEARAGAPKLAIVVPCHNEQEVLRETAAVLLGRLESMRNDGLVSEDSFICFVDDGSTDATWGLIRELHGSNPRLTGIKLTRNFGHQGAVLAGVLECDADAVITIDADLQDDDACIVTMVREHLAGYDIVLGVRNDRRSDNAGKRAAAESYYRLLGLLGIHIYFNHADYRLMSRRAIGELRRYPEANLFLRGIVPMLGLPTAMVHYRRRARAAGTSKYTPRSMLSLAWEGITSFSIAPLRLVSALGFLIAIGSLSVTAWALWVKFFRDAAVPGWASTVVPMYFLGGVQILCIGIIGEYIGKIYLESKRRPRYSIQTKLHTRAPAEPDAAQPERSPRR
jgi:glycosyltransferase involved in cell wall biosynthesis